MELEESDHDLELMTAIGAPPRLRRVFHGVQAGYHAALAAVLGLPLALLISLSLHDPADIPLTVPWAWISVIVVGLPLAVGLTHLVGARSARVGAPRRIA